MNPIDLTIFIVYILIVLAVGLYFHRRNKDHSDYYTGGRDMSSVHIGLSVVATDVGGGFSIGLGGLGFAMGLSGSWMLFTGLVGAWLSAVLLIPKVINKAHRLKFLTFPQLLGDAYGPRVALVAGVISFIGYLGFTASQLLAGAKLAVGTFPALNINAALLIMGATAVVYTAFGGIKAVIYTDTFQWALLMGGLILIGIPLSYTAIGGYQGLVSHLPEHFLSLTNITWIQLANWGITIIPIWFVGMTLYQRIYACRDEQTAKKAWYLAGLFEYPVMAFMGVLLGLFSRVAVEQGMFAAEGFAQVAQMDAELGLPMLLRNVLPVGLMGLMLSAYFSAIMSTADSCLLAASGNLLTDILGIDADSSGSIVVSQLLTFGIGAVSLVLAAGMTSVLDLMLMSYAFMVAGLLVPVLMMLYGKRKHATAAFWSMLVGGGSTLIMTLLDVKIPFGFDPILVGLVYSAVAYFVLSLLPDKRYGIH